MAFHVRATLVAIAAVLLTAGYCAWQLSHAAQNHFNEQKINVTTQSLQLTKKQVEEYLDKTANELTQLIQTEINQNDISEQFTQSDFMAASVSSVGEGNKWNIDWYRTKNAAITQDFLTSQLSTLELGDIQNDKVQVGRIEAPDKRVYFTVSVQIRFKTPEGETVKVATGVVPISYFQSLLDITKGSNDEGLLVDSKGYAISYPDQQYVGAKVDTHPVVKMALQGAQGSEVSFSQNIKGEAVVGGYEKLGQSNLTLVLSSPVMSRSSAMMQSILQIVLFCIALMIAVAGVLVFWGRQNKMKTDFLLNRIKVLEQRQQNPAELSLFVAEQTKKEILREFAFGVVQILRTPMTAIIGQAQLLNDKVKDSEHKSLSSRIERETRQNRDFVEQLAMSYGLTDIKQTIVEAETVVMPVVHDLKAIFNKNEIKLEENIKTRARVSVPQSDLRQTLRHVFNLMIDRLSLKTGYRKISINIEQGGPHIFIKISDNAAKPEKEFLAQIFSPFKVSGLNFSLMRSLIESADGQVTARDAEGGGLEIVIQLTEDKTEMVAKSTDAGIDKSADMVKTGVQKRKPEPINIVMDEAKASVETTLAAPVEKRIEIPIPDNVDLEAIMSAKAPVKEEDLKGMKAVDMAASFGLPEVPRTDDIDADVKKAIVAEEEMKVTIRKPKTRFES